MSDKKYCRICEKKFINEKLHTKRYHHVIVAGQEVHVAEDYIDYHD